MHSPPIRRNRPARTDRHPTSAVTWIDAAHALVARSGPGGAVTVHEVVPAPAADLPSAPYLAEVVDELAGCEHVMVLGPDPLRLALEREYVAIEGRPERLVDGPPSPPLDQDALIASLRGFAEH